MSRHGYVDDYDGPELALYRGRVARAFRGQRGQAFLREMAEALDAMPEKVLITHDLVNDEGDCCAMGAVCLARGTDVSQIDPENPDEVAAAVDIAESMAAEIAYENDEGWWGSESPEHRWQRMRKWVQRAIDEPYS